MKKEEINTYLEKIYDYIEFKYIYKDKLEIEYLKNFGFYELENMKNTYEALLYNKKAEANLMNIRSKSVEDSIYMDRLAELEYYDLLLQINRLDKSIKKIKEKKSFSYPIEDIKTIIYKAHPLFNTSKRSAELYSRFLEALEGKRWDEIEELSKEAVNLRRYKNKSNNFQEDCEIYLKSLEEKKKTLRGKYPYNQIEIMENKDLKNEKTLEIKQDVESSKMGLSKIRDLYLYSSEPLGLES